MQRLYDFQSLESQDGRSLKDLLLKPLSKIELSNSGEDDPVITYLLLEGLSESMATLKAEKSSGSNYASTITTLF
jgi:hypothetical protein